MVNMIQIPMQRHETDTNIREVRKILTSKGSVAINGAHASRVIGFSVGRNIVLTYI